MSKVGRNDACPCGSGKKYKRCCLTTTASLQPHPMHRVDEEVVHEIFKFARRRFGDAWFESAEEIYLEGTPLMPGEEPLMMQWWAYHHVIHDAGIPMVDLFLEERGTRLDDLHRRWIRAQKEAWVSLWEVCTVQPELGTAQLRDVLSGEERVVYDIGLSTNAEPLLVFLARVVDFDGTSLLCGSHSALTPLQAQAVIQQLREYIHKPRARIRSSILRESDVAEELVSLWRGAVDAAMHPTMPRLANTDGDSLEWTEDTFAFDPHARNEILQHLGNVGTVHESQSETFVSFVREGNRLSPALPTTSLGRAIVDDDSLRIESNSTNRADSLRRQIEQACGDWLHFRKRNKKQIEEMLRESVSAPANEDLIELPEMQEALKEHKRQYYTTWLDQPIPALGGLTPRKAAGNAGKRPVLKALIKDIELHEKGLDHRQRADLQFLWDELNLKR